jgi:tetratricopeptide (TPR) repeat protein
LGLIGRQFAEEEAADAFRRAWASTGASPTADHARALHGQLAWQAGHYAAALGDWQGIAPARLKSWRLDGVIGGTAYLAGLQALKNGQADESRKWLRAAARLGYSDPSLDLVLAEVCSDAESPEKTIARLENAIEAAGPKPILAATLARLYRRMGRRSDAHQLLDRVASDEWRVASDRSSSLAIRHSSLLWSRLLRERGLLHLSEGHLLPAERAFAESVAHDPSHGGAWWNLLYTRMSLGRVSEAAEIVGEAIQHAPSPELRRLGRLIGALVSSSRPSIQNWTTADDESLKHFLRRIGRLDAVNALFEQWAKIRPESELVRKVESELAPLLAKQMLDRGDPSGVLRRFGPDAAKGAAVLRNLLGVAAALRQDFASAVRHFRSALPGDGRDARVQQNLAIVEGWVGNAAAADRHWSVFVDCHVAQTRRPPEIANYHRRIEEIVRSQMGQAEFSA